MTKNGKNPRPHVLYGHMKEKELINLIKETAATYKTRQGRTNLRDETGT